MKMPTERRYVTGEGDSIFRFSYIGDKSDPKSRIVHLREDVAQEALEAAKKVLREYQATRKSENFE
jgi:hypothetical protein